VLSGKSRLTIIGRGFICFKFSKNYGIRVGVIEGRGENGRSIFMYLEKPIHMDSVGIHFR
jgi:hypothetical protein